jgi:hypothetical protein
MLNLWTSFLILSWTKNYTEKLLIYLYIQQEITKFLPILRTWQNISSYVYTDVGRRNLQSVYLVRLGYTAEVHFVGAITSMYLSKSQKLDQKKTGLYCKFRKNIGLRNVLCIASVHSCILLKILLASVNLYFVVS